MTPQTSTPQEPQQSSSSTQTQAPDLSISHVISICAVGLCICFFLPWINFLFQKPTGLDFAKDGGKALLLWSVPIFSIVTVFAGMTKRNQRAVGLLTGALPFLILAYCLNKEGRDLLRILDIGAYGGLGLGLLILALSSRVK